MRDPWRRHPGRRLALGAVATAAAVVVGGAALASAFPDSDSGAAAAPVAQQSPDADADAPGIRTGGDTAASSRTSATADQAQLQAEVDASTTEVREVATTAVAAWQLPDTAARTAALTPLATPEFLAASATIDPTFVPSAAVESASTVTDSDGLARVQVRLTDGTVLLVDLRLDAAWLVADILPAG